MFVYSQRQNKVQRDSTTAVLSVSCTKNIDNHKSFYGFQDVGNDSHVFNARKHQDNDDLGLAVEKHLSPKTLIGPGKLPGLSRNGPQGLKAAAVYGIPG